MSIPLKSRTKEDFEIRRVLLKPTIKPRGFQNTKMVKSNPDEPCELEYIGWLQPKCEVQLRILRPKRDSFPKYL